MPFEIKNNRLLIILPNQQNASILNLHSKLSHICRKILKVAASILCFKGCRNQNGPDENGKIHGYYSFETFEAKIDDKIYYINKEQYFNLKRAINPHPRYIQNFSEDLLRTIREPDVNIQKNAPKINLNPDVQPQVPQEPIPLNPYLVKKAMDKEKEIQDSVKDAESFLKFMSESRYESDEMWMERLAVVKKEVFEKAVIDFEKSPEQRKAVYQKLYLLSSNDQQESLINLLAYPEYLAASYPRDVELKTKVANKIFADPNHLKQLFEKIDQDADLKGFLLEEFIPLAEELLKKFSDDKQILTQAGKNNAFGFDKNPSFSGIDHKGMINVIFHKLPYEKAQTILLSTIDSAGFTTGFGLKLLTQALKELNPENEQQLLSNEMIEFSTQFFYAMLKANNCTVFLKEMLNYNDNGPMRKNMETFINCFIIGALRSPRPKQILNMLVTRSLYMVALNPKPTQPNPVLETHLTPEQKQNYLNWARNHRLVDDAHFQN